VRRRIRRAPDRIPGGAELHGEPLLLIVTTAVEIDAVAGTGHAHEAMFSATLAADESAQAGAYALAFALFAVGALAHLAGAPSFVGVGGPAAPNP
jgi:hypothetical protein